MVSIELGELLWGTFRADPDLALNRRFYRGGTLNPPFVRTTDASAVNTDRGPTTPPVESTASVFERPFFRAGV